MGRLRAMGALPAAALAWLVAVGCPLGVGAGGGASLSLWVDTWFVRDRLQIIEGPAFTLALNVSKDHYAVTVTAGTRRLEIPRIPLPADVYVLHLGVVTGSNHHTDDRRLTAYADLKPYPTNAAPSGAEIPPSVAGACRSLAPVPRPAFHRKVIVTCETKELALGPDDEGMRIWAQHQRDNTVGLEPRLFLVDANGLDVAQRGRHATLSYSFTVRLWYVFRGCEDRQPLFWQGTIALAAVSCPDPDHHVYRLFFGDGMDIWTSEPRTKAKTGAVLHFAVSRDVLRGSVHLFEGGHLLKATRDTSSPDAILAAFEAPTEDLRRDVVLELACDDRPTHAADLREAVRRATPPDAPAADGDDAPPPAQPPEPPPPAPSPIGIRVHGVRGAAEGLDLPGPGPFTLELMVTPRGAPKTGDTGASVLLVDGGPALRWWLSVADDKATHRVAAGGRRWTSDPVPVDAEEPLHVALVRPAPPGRPPVRLYHGTQELRVAPAPRRPSVSWPSDDPPAAGLVEWADVFHAALPLADFVRLSDRRPPPEDREIRGGLLWLLGLLLFGVVLGGFLALVAVDRQRGAKAGDKVV